MCVVYWHAGQLDKIYHSQDICFDLLKGRREHKWGQCCGAYDLSPYSEVPKLFLIPAVFILRVLTIFEWRSFAFSLCTGSWKIMPTAGDKHYFKFHLFKPSFLSTAFIATNTCQQGPFFSVTPALVMDYWFRRGYLPSPFASLLPWPQEGWSSSPCSVSPSWFPQSNLVSPILSLAGGSFNPQGHKLPRAQ